VRTLILITFALSLYSCGNNSIKETVKSIEIEKTEVIDSIFQKENIGLFITNLQNNSMIDISDKLLLKRIDSCNLILKNNPNNIEVKNILGKTYYNYGIYLNTIESNIHPTWGCKYFLKAKELGYVSNSDYSLKSCNENYIQLKDSIQIKILKQEMRKLYQYIFDYKIHEVTDLIDFPLGPSSSYAFNYYGNENLKNNKQQVLKNYNYFFRDIFVDSLKVDTENYEIKKRNGVFRFYIRIRTWDPANKNRSWGLECSHKILGYLKGSTLRIDSFDLFCLEK
jgi:hypothetical protein